MQFLVEGHDWYQKRIFPQKSALYESLAGGQSPRYLFITCSDSRVQPHEFTQAEAGDIFMDRSIGNLVPPYGGSENEAVAVIEYALVALGVSHVIVCGHSSCGAMKALLDPGSLEGMPNVAAWLINARGTEEAVRRKYSHLQGEALLEATIRENVLVQLDNLRVIPCVADRLKDGRVAVHGWVYDFAHGRALAYDPRSAQFLPLGEVYRTADA